MKKREGENTQDQASIKKDLITGKDSRQSKEKTSQSPFLVDSPFFC